MSVQQFLNNKGVDVIVDVHERASNPDIYKSLSQLVKVAVDSLPAGDYLLLASEGKKPLLVERKTVTDYLNSLKGRIFSQLEALRSLSKEVDVLILIEGYWGLIRKLNLQWNEASIARLTDEILLSWRIPILYSVDKRFTITWLTSKAKSLGEPERKQRKNLRTSPKSLSLNDRILYTLEGVCGYQTAVNLLKKFKTLRAIANASKRELMDTELVGEKRAELIYKVFNTEWR